VRIIGLLSLLSLLLLASCGWNSTAFSDSAKPSPDLAEYVYLHETRGQAIPLLIAARAAMCRGMAGGTR